MLVPLLPSPIHHFRERGIRIGTLEGVEIVFGKVLGENEGCFGRRGVAVFEERCSGSRRDGVGDEVVEEFVRTFFDQRTENPEDEHTAEELVVLCVRKSRANASICR
jgi:hypothetical protein